MLGAVAGDIIASPYERMNTDRLDFELFLMNRGLSHGKMVTYHPRFTDGTVTTLAVARWIESDRELSRQRLVRNLIDFGNKYPQAGYSPRFQRWLDSESHRPNYSYDNGSAVRVSPVGMYVDDLADVMRVAALSAEVSHNHPDSIKGAQAVAQAVWMARKGRSKEDIIFAMTHDFGYDLNIPYDDLRSLLRGCVPEPIVINGEETGETFFRETGKKDITCNLSVTAALRAFIESDDYESAVRRCVALGGDSASIAAICGSIAAPFYGGVPENITKRCDVILDSSLRQTMGGFERFLTGPQKVNVQDKEPTVRDSFSVIRRDDHMPVFVVAKGRDDIIKAIREKFGEDSQIIRPERLKAFLKSIREPVREGTYIESPRPDMRTLFVQDGKIRGPLSYTGPNAAPMDERIAAFNGMMDILGYAREVKAELQRISGYDGEGSVHYATAYYPVIYHNALEIYQGDYLDGRITWDEYNCKMRIEEDGDLRDGEYLEADWCRERVFFSRGFMGPDEIKAAIGRFCLDDGVGVGDNRKSNIDAAINDIALSTDEKINGSIGYSASSAKSNGPKI